jgi:hypothetical protein
LDDNQVKNIKIELNNNIINEKNIEFRYNKICPKEILKLVVISKYRQMLREFKLSINNLSNENIELKRNIEN